jgi:hypothetical protein
MKAVDCEFECEVLAAVLQSRWPERVDANLLTHAAACAICSDVAAIAGAIDGARDQIRAHAVVPDSGRMWWLAQLRARREAAAAAGRPITAAQVIAFACAVGLLGACFGATSTWFQSALARMHTLLPATTALIAGHGVLVLAAAAVVVLVPAAVYLTMLRD